GATYNSGSVVLSGEFAAGLSQIIYDKQITRGLQTLSFNLKNTEGGSESFQKNKILVTLYGVNGEFENDLYSGEGPTQVGVLSMNSVKLLEEDLGGSSYDWKEFTRDIDLETGYDYLMFQVNTSQADDSGDFIDIDDVELIGEGLPIVIPEDIIVPELIQNPPEINIPPIEIINNPEILGQTQPELAQDTQNNGIFTLPEDKNLKFSLDNLGTKNVSEIGLFVVDDENGNINGIAPNSENYLQAALVRSQLIFSTISNPPNGFNTKDIQRILELDSQRQFGFYIIPKGTKETAIAKNSAILFSNSSQIEVNNFNQNGFNLKLSEISLNVQFAEDTPATGTKLQAQKELIDLRDKTGSVSVNIEVYREAEYDNIIGFYQVADADGGIDITGDGIADINAGEQGYKEAALNNRITTIDLLQTENQQTANYDGILEGGSLISSFMIVDATLEEALNGDAEVLFSQLGANTDNVDSVRMLGDNIFGFEDSGIGGDFDYNDAIVKMDFGG
ncbi:MAG: DUF4114 domain-containing protein, partial [Rivularia sp. (in: cyanobacteria)]